MRTEGRRRGASCGRLRQREQHRARRRLRAARRYRPRPSRAYASSRPACMLVVATRMRMHMQARPTDAVGRTDRFLLFALP
ncbi:hypothetical protein WJ22_01450 [Burkholderia vietnamiensis]|nr:hypothetical protein WJ18_22330 [Burkholderia vietnamiensis]KVF81698.1 hypothetical protein WJ19_27830 [Burkholderia vietnamiensis]KVF92183.1 hypothetical protein WJ20_08895 [Burkholderia vietnamiensis]KVG02444.1 hypothetical protein WJ22_01450 [Burkholderia vietnamiensis]